MAWQRQWHRHPAVRSDDKLSLGERAADRLRNGMGSWTFVFIALAFLAAWMGFNEVVARRAAKPFDPYPFILLNLVLSCLAALQGAILLIAAKRADQISSEVARHDYETDIEADALIKAIHEITTEISGRLVALEKRVGTATGLAQAEAQRSGPSACASDPD